MERETVKAMRSFYKSITLLVVFLVICLPLWGFSLGELADHDIRSEIISPGFPPTILDPVSSCLGPTYDVDWVIEEMQRDQKWRFHEISDRIDLDELTSLPGRMAVYTLTGNRLIITYTYLAPFPIMRAFGFYFYNDPYTDMDIIIYFREEVLLYPFYPGQIGSIANP